MNELIAVLCVAFLAGGWIIFMIGRKKWKGPDSKQVWLTSFIYEQIMDKKDWLSYNKKNIGWAIGLGVMSIIFLILRLVIFP